MNGRLTALGCAGGAYLFASVAVAQPMNAIPIGPMTPGKPALVEAVKAGRIKKNFARCIYSLAPRSKVDQLLDNSDPMRVYIDDGGIDKMMADFRMEQCLKSNLKDSTGLSYRFPMTVIRDMLMEEAYLKKYATPPQLASGAAEVLNRNFFSTGDNLNVARSIASFSDCVVFREVGKADALLRTIPGSDEERRAARVLAPVLGTCIDAGQTGSLNVGKIRAYMADALWQRFVRTGVQNAPAS